MHIIIKYLINFLLVGKSILCDFKSVSSIAIELKSSCGTFSLIMIKLEMTDNAPLPLGSLWYNNNFMCPNFWDFFTAGHE